MASQNSFPRSAVIETGARLHFGLIRVGQAQLRYGGLGVMIAEPNLVLHVAESKSWNCDGPLGSRVLENAKAILATGAVSERQDIAFRFQVESAMPQHSGLGSGTQLSLAIAAGMHAVLGSPLPSSRQMALETGRGRRSAIGCHGFYEGGLLFEGGKQEHEPLSELQGRFDFPSEWRFVLIRPRSLTGVAGPLEGKLFQQAPQAANDLAEEMIRLVREEMAPAVTEVDFSRFSCALYDYGCLAGESFAFFQGDTFSHPTTRLRVEDLRGRGVAGVGQSSWGPTVFALMENQQSANVLKEDLGGENLYQDCEIWVTAARNEGAKISLNASNMLVSDAANKPG